MFDFQTRALVEDVGQPTPSQVAAPGAPKNEPRPGIRAAEAKDQVSGVRAGRHENPHSISSNA